tara:strand:- start:112 stop:396 length:285 start_codon:yes stop_codon:yes gene_type:complete
MNPRYWEGLHVATLTAFSDDEELLEDPEVYKAYARYLKESEVAGLFVNGTSGESLSLSVSERKKTLQMWADATKGLDLKVIVHVGAECIKVTRR